MNRIKKASFLVPIWLLGLSSVFASEVNWTGFASFVAGRTIDSDTEYDVSSFGREGAIYYDEISFQPDTIMGLQGVIPMTDNSRATMQIIARGTEAMNAELEWAYITYDVTPKLALNIGKFRMPLYSYSDFLDVGYAYYWVRPPTEIYLAPSSVIGIRTDYTDYVGSIDFTISGWYSTDDRPVEFGNPPAPVQVKTEDSWGITMLATYEWMSFRFVYHEATGVFDALNLSVKVDKFGLAYNIDYGNILFRSEYSGLKVEPNDDFDIDWYGSIGYNINGFTPHFTYTDSETNDRKVYTYGLAYDLGLNAKLKAEYSDVQNSLDGVDDAGLVTVGIDLVF